MKTILTTLALALAAMAAQAGESDRLLLLMMAAQHAGQDRAAQYYYGQAEAAARRESEARIWGPAQGGSCPINQSPTRPGVEWVCVCDTSGQCSLVPMRSR